MSGTNAIASTAMDLQSLPFAALEAIWTGTPTGTFSVDGSLDKVTWYPTNTSVNNPAGSASSTLINIGFPIGFRWLRLSYTNASGVGALTVNGMAKGGK